MAKKRADATHSANIRQKKIFIHRPAGHITASLASYSHPISIYLYIYTRDALVRERASTSDVITRENMGVVVVVVGPTLLLLLSPSLSLSLFRVLLSRALFFFATRAHTAQLRDTCIVKGSSRGVVIARRGGV